jgi:hypothetical protein
MQIGGLMFIGDFVWLFREDVEVEMANSNIVNVRYGKLQTKGMSDIVKKTTVKIKYEKC